MLLNKNEKLLIIVFFYLRHISLNLLVTKKTNSMLDFLIINLGGNNEK
ncbi:hypothetical protein BMS3Abin04_02756 [bacterium BMS3Abin04]|nr:hypothetical protein BMS3Abin04_02756 [bacterium BMS3Abin04]